MLSVLSLMTAMQIASSLLAAVLLGNYLQSINSAQVSVPIGCSNKCHQKILYLVRMT